MDRQRNRRQEQPGKRPTKKRRPRVSITQQRNRNALFVGVAFSLAFCFLMGAILYIQLVQGEAFNVYAARQRHRTHSANVHNTVTPTRGAIMDRDMQPLATSIPIFDIFIDVTLLESAYQRSEAGREMFNEHMDALNTYLHVPRVELMRIFETYRTHDRASHHHIVARGVDATTAFNVSRYHHHIHATERSRRLYHDPMFAPQIIGFIRGDTSWGLESLYNRDLAGTPGRTLLVQGEAEDIAVRHGHTLITTLDSDIQRVAQNAASQLLVDLNAEATGVIVMDPFTGEILAMAQGPTFSNADPVNPDYITDRWLQYHWDYLTEAQRMTGMQAMWQNFHTTSAYEHGSTFKPIVIAAALEEGIISPNSTFFCSGRKYIWGPEWLTCWREWGHGSVNLSRTIAESCNVAMFYIVDQMGADLFYRYRGYFGFGERTGIDLPSETAVSSPAVMYTRAALGPVQLATSSMGQGFNATTLQAITAYAALINGGNLLQPFVVSQIVDSMGNVVEETQPTVVRRVISAETSDFMRRHMQYTVTSETGTARTGSIPGHTLGGKTGTGQQGIRALGIDSLSYIAFTPVENPEFLVMMVAHRVSSEVGGAGANLAPRVRDLFQEIINIRGLRPSDGPYAHMDWQAHIAPAAQMPDYSGQRLVDAVRDLSNRSGSGFQVVGSGTRVSHTFPSPGRPMPENAPVFFHMDPDSRIDQQMSIVPNLTGLTIAQAEFMLRELGLPIVLLSSIELPSVADGAVPRTSNRLTEEELAEAANQGGPSPMPYIIYQQFPEAGTELERGTMVMVRAR